MSKELDQWEACKELAKIVLVLNDAEMAAYAIQEYVVASENNESQRMSLSLASNIFDGHFKKQLKLNLIS